jgi:predicted Zn-dependent peptidase
LKGSIMLSLESTGSRMFKLARSEMYYGRQIELDEILQRVDAVTLDAVSGMAAELFAPDQIGMAAIGPFGTQAASRAELERTFSTSLTSLGPAPVAAPLAGD